VGDGRIYLTGCPGRLDLLHAPVLRSVKLKTGDRKSKVRS
jgi:hypothetical protein